MVCKARHVLWRSILPSSNVFGYEAPVRTTLGVGTSTRRVSSRDTEVADLELAIDANQEVVRFEVTTNDVDGPNVLPGSVLDLEHRLIGVRLMPTLVIFLIAQPTMSVSEDTFVGTLAGFLDECVLDIDDVRRVEGSEGVCALEKEQGSGDEGGDGEGNRVN